MRKGAEIPQLPYWLKKPILQGERKFSNSKTHYDNNTDQELRRPPGASGSSAGIIPLPSFRPNQVLPVAHRQHILLAIQRTDGVSI